MVVIHRSERFLRVPPGFEGSGPKGIRASGPVHTAAGGRGPASRLLEDYDAVSLTRSTR